MASNLAAGTCTSRTPICCITDCSQPPCVANNSWIVRSLTPCFAFTSSRSATCSASTPAALMHVAQNRRPTTITLATPAELPTSRTLISLASDIRIAFLFGTCRFACSYHWRRKHAKTGRVQKTSVLASVRDVFLCSVSQICSLHTAKYPMLFFISCCHILCIHVLKNGILLSHVTRRE